MGSAGSKAGKQYTEETLQEGSVPSTPILTPKLVKNQELDPRSPSTHIARTPLQLPSTFESLEGENGNSIDIVNDETPVRNKTILLGIDPRSPTTDFKRTPIVINVEPDLPKKIRNKNLDKVKASAIITNSACTPDKSISLERLSSNLVPPKLLESSPIRSKTDVNKRKSFVGLLETNIDFTETDLDAVILEKGKGKLLNESYSPQKDYISLLQKESVDPRSPTNDFIRTPLQLAKKLSGIELNDEEPDSIIEVESKRQEVIGNATQIIVKSQENIETAETEDVQEINKDIDIVNTKVNINEKLVLASKDSAVLETEKDMIYANKDTLTIEKGVEIEKVTVEHIVVKAVVEVEIPKETKSAPVTPPVTNVKEKSMRIVSPVMKKPKSAPVTPPEVNLTADVKELDKKLTNLIYQDEDVVVCPRIVTLKEYSNRSPLRNCNSNEPEKKKSAQKLKVSDKPRKSDFAVSKIPVYKEKAKKSVVQCENTPPRNMDRKKVKAKKSHWDNTNTTLII